MNCCQKAFKRAFCDVKGVAGPPAHPFRGFAPDPKIL
jgi:hypothetical protein